MNYALVSGQRVEASAGERGTCPRCNGEVIAKCGTQRVSHWAHRGVRDCDSWAEQETDWHRAWKSKFPVECQEFIQYDEQSGEKHIADIRTPHGLVIFSIRISNRQNGLHASTFTETWCGSLMAPT
jgi:competence protein CoiA